MSTHENKTIRILLADGQELVVAGLRTLFQAEPDLELIAAANNFEDTLALTQKFVPDLVLFDFMLRDGNCIERIPELLCVCPSCKVLILTASLNREKHLLALRHGAVGVITIDQPSQILLKAIYRVNSGEVWLSNALSREILQGFNTPLAKAMPIQNGNSLTPRELTIARLAAQGILAKQIAATLFISEKTVRNQLVIIYSKLGACPRISLSNEQPLFDSAKF